jgi:hypothetical protein
MALTGVAVLLVIVAAFGASRRLAPPLGHLLMFSPSKLGARSTVAVLAAADRGATGTSAASQGGSMPV